PRGPRANGLGGVTPRSAGSPIIEAVVAQPSAKLDPERAGSVRHCAPSRRIQDRLGDRHIRPLALSFALHATAFALAYAMLRERTQLRTASVGAIGGRPS